MTERDVLKVMVVAYLALLGGAGWAAWGIVRDWRRENGWESLLFTALTIMDVLVIVAALGTVPLAVTTLLDLPSLPFSGIVIVLVLMVMLVAVIVHRLAFDRVKAQRGRVREAPTIAPETRPTEEPANEDSRRTAREGQGSARN